MLGENKSNVGVPVFFDANLLQYPSNSSNQLQLFGSAVGCNVDNVNYIEGEQNNPIFRPNKRGREAAAISRQQMHQISLNHNIYHEETDRTARNPIKTRVSTGLKLSYEDDERNSSITNATASMNPSPSVFLSLGDNYSRQNEEFDQYIKTQEENLMKGMREIKRRHIASFMTGIEKEVNKKIREKDIEIENINRKNGEVVQRIKQVATEAQNWHYRAKYSESVVNTLKTNLQQALSLGAADQTKEGFGDSEIDDTASCIDPNNYLGVMSKDHHSMICRSCKVKEVRVLLMPCRHLCLCIDCEGLVSVCPVCQLFKNATLEVFFS